jgi:glycine cleavage system pyridoxal-binding protein P
MVSDLTGMRVANGSLLDEATTAAAEGMTMLHRVPRNASTSVVVPAHFSSPIRGYPQTLDLHPGARRAARDRGGS